MTDRVSKNNESGSGVGTEGAQELEERIYESLDPANMMPSTRSLVRSAIHRTLAAIQTDRERGEVAYLHVLHLEAGQKARRVTFNAEHPFGERGKDYSPEYNVTTTPLFAAREQAGEGTKDPDWERER